MASSVVVLPRYIPPGRTANGAHTERYVVQRDCTMGDTQQYLIASECEFLIDSALNKWDPFRDR